jgi:hypothetical protein
VYTCGSDHGSFLLTANISMLQLVRMGVYLSTPRTEKLSENGENERLKFGLSSMQGWRASMEDAVSFLIQGYFSSFGILLA